MPTYRVFFTGRRIVIATVDVEAEDEEEAEARAWRRIGSADWQFDGQVDDILTQGCVAVAECAASTAGNTES